MYPKAMFDFNEARQICIDKMKEAYDTGLYGDDQKVVSGEWKKIFGYSDGKKNKDETNSKSSKSQKRGRNSEEHEDDDGANADIGDATDEEPPRKTRKAPPKSDPKGKQGNLDGMVTRAKKKS